MLQVKPHGYISMKLSEVETDSKETLLPLTRSLIYLFYLLVAIIVHSISYSQKSSVIKM